MPQTTYKPPPLLATTTRHARSILGAMADEALGVILAVLSVLARLAWLFGTLCFLTAGVMAIGLWCNGNASDAWTMTYLAGMSLAIMAGARYVGGLYLRYRLRHASI